MKSLLKASDLKKEKGKRKKEKGKKKKGKRKKSVKVSGKKRNTDDTDIADLHR